MTDFKWLEEATKLFTQEDKDVNRLYQILDVQMVGLGVSPDFRHLSKEGKEKYIIPLIRYHDRTPTGFYIEIIKDGVMYRSSLHCVIVATGG